MNAIFAEQLNHPGVAHYLIHSYDSAPLAELGLTAAICYSKIAPSSASRASHAVTYFHAIGQMAETRSMQTAHRWPQAKTTRLRHYGAGVAWDQSLHAMDFLEYAYLQLGQDYAAKELVDDVDAFREATPATPGAAYAMAAIPRAMPWSEGIVALAANLHFRRRQCPGPAFPGQRR